MKKILILLTFVFMTSALLFGQCPDEATPNPNNRNFNLEFVLEADRDAAFAALDSITFPAGAECMCGATIAIAKADLATDGPVGPDEVYRIRAVTSTPDYFGGVNGNFEGTVTFHNTDGSTTACEYEMTTSNSTINGSAPVAIFPNPVKDQLTLTNGKGQATIYNALGQAVKHLTIDAEQSTIQLSDLLKGQYYLQVIQADGTVVTKQFVKVF